MFCIASKVVKKLINFHLVQFNSLIHWCQFHQHFSNKQLFHLKEQKEIGAKSASKMLVEIGYTYKLLSNIFIFLYAGKKTSTLWSCFVPTQYLLIVKKQELFIWNICSWSKDVTMTRQIFCASHALFCHKMNACFLLMRSLSVSYANKLIRIFLSATRISILNQAATFVCETESVCVCVCERERERERDW